MPYHLGPPTQHFIDQLNAAGGKPIYTLTPEQARNFLEDLQAQVEYDIPADVEDLDIPELVPIRIVRPINPEEDILPVIIFIHGGGWILGSENTHDRLIRELANGSQAAVVFVNYTPSPEARFPEALEEIYDVLEYIDDHGPELGLDPNRIAIVGDSVGGNMATATALLAKQRNGPSIKYQALFYPVTDARMNTESYRQFANGPWLTKAAMQWFWDAYEPDKRKRNDPLQSPLQATLEDLAGLPPGIIITDENDVLRDEGEAYAHKLMEAGVKISAIRVLGTLHDFMMLNPIKDTPAVRGAIRFANSSLYEALH